MNQLTSPHNPRIKEIARLARRTTRDERRLTVVEGLREARHALDNGITPLEVYLCPILAMDEKAKDLALIIQRLETMETPSLFEVTPEIFAKLAYREGSDGILLVIPYINRTIDQIPLQPSPFLCVIEGAEKPGNLGAILRTADAAGVDGVIVCSGGTDLHNPNVIRASLGALFTVPIVECTSTQAILWLHKHNIRIVATTPHSPTLYTGTNMTGPIAVVMGSEAHGLGRDWLAAADVAVSIPMFGSADSLNLATSTALLLYEVVRQRSFKVG